MLYTTASNGIPSARTPIRPWFDINKKSGASQLWISTYKYWVNLMIQMALPVILVPKQVFACTLSSFPCMINVLKDFREVAVLESTCLQSRAILPLWNLILPFFITVSCRTPSFLSQSCSCRRSMCSSCHTATGTGYYVVMQADMEAFHLNAKNRTCICV